METAFFYLFAVLTLLCGLLVIANPFSRNPVTSAMFLVLTIVSMAGLFVMLHAFFLAAVQILVYAGAVIVLFVFIIMLLDIKEEEHRHIKGPTGVASLIVVALIAVAMIVTVRHSMVGFALEHSRVEGSTIELGRSLFSGYALPLELLSLLLLVAMIGAVLLSKKDLR